MGERSVRFFFRKETLLAKVRFLGVALLGDLPARTKTQLPGEFPEKTVHTVHLMIIEDLNRTPRPFTNRTPSIRPYTLVKTVDIPPPTAAPPSVDSRPAAAATLWV